MSNSAGADNTNTSAGRWAAPNGGAGGSRVRAPGVEAVASRFGSARATATPNTTPLATKYCPSCGEPVASGAYTFCTKCGEPLAKPGAASGASSSGSWSSVKPTTKEPRASLLSSLPPPVSFPPPPQTPKAQPPSKPANYSGFVKPVGSNSAATTAPAVLTASAPLVRSASGPTKSPSQPPVTKPNPVARVKLNNTGTYFSSSLTALSAFEQEESKPASSEKPRVPASTAATISEREFEREKQKELERKLQLELETEKKAHAEELDKLKKELEAKARDLVQTHLVEAKKQEVILRSQLKECEAQRDRLNVDLHRNQNVLRAVETDLAAARQQVNQITAEKDKLESSEQSLHIKIKEIEEQHAKKISDVSNAQDNIRKGQEELVVARLKLEQLAAEKADAEQNLKRADEMAKKLTAEQQQGDERFRAAKAELEARLIALSDQVAGLKDEKQQLAENLAELDRQHAEETKLKKEFADDLLRSRRLQEELERANQVLEDRLAEAHRLGDEVRRAAFEDKERELDNVKGSFVQLFKEKEALREELKNLQASLSVQEETHCSSNLAVEELQSILAQRTQEIEISKTELARLEHAKEQSAQEVQDILGKMQQESEEHQRQHNEMQELLETLRHQLKEKDSNMEQEKANWTQQRAELTQNEEAWKKARADLEQERDESQRRSNDLASSLQEALRSHEELAKQLHELQERATTKLEDITYATQPDKPHTEELCVHEKPENTEDDEAKMEAQVREMEAELIRVEREEMMLHTLEQLTAELAHVKTKAEQAEIFELKLHSVEAAFHLHQQELAKERETNTRLAALLQEKDEQLLQAQSNTTSETPDLISADSMEELESLREDMQLKTKEIIYLTAHLREAEEQLEEAREALQKSQAASDKKAA